MSHQPERIEKNCLNCGTTVAGRYCQKCGQENIVTKQSIWGLIKHFIYDIFHFDGKFFDTLGSLLFRPGKVPRGYVAGKRTSYLDPIRMYLFTSAIFFLVFFSVSGTDNIVRVDDDERSMSKVERLKYASVIHARLNSGETDTTLRQQLAYLLDTTYRIELATSKVWAGDTSYNIQLDNHPYFMSAYKIRGESDNVQFRVGSNWLNQRLKDKWRSYKKKFADDDKALAADLANTFLHKFPYILFVSLPFFALILKLLYVRRKQFYYSDHAVFTLYHYIFTFLQLLVIFLILELNDWVDVGIFKLLAVLLFLSGGVYLLLAMKRFYLQGWGRTVVKFLLLNILAFIVVTFLMLIFIVLSVFQL